jgi:hypothetical protein
MGPKIGGDAMGMQLRSWWQKARKPLEIVGIIVVCILIIALLVVIVMVYLFNVNVPGLRGKTLWDWMQLLLIPVVLAIAGFWFNHRERKSSERLVKEEKDMEQQRAKVEQDIASDNQREAALQAYIDKMTELLLHEGLRKSSEDAEVRRIATLQKLTALPRLDGKRKGSVLLFLHEAGLIEESNPIIMFGAAGLHGADLRGCDLSGISGASLYGGFISYATLDGANFTGVHLRGICFVGGSLCNAQFIGTDLRDSQFFEIDLSGADLTGADLTNASLIAVNLIGTIVTDKQLNKAKSLKGATMPDGTKHD